MQVFAAPGHITPPNLSDFMSPYNADGLYAAEAEYRAQLSAWAKQHGAHKLAGQFVSVPFADGSAEYCIAKLDGKVSLIHVPLMDAWHDDRFCRLATVKELTTMVENAAARKKLFADHV